MIIFKYICDYCKREQENEEDMLILDVNKTALNFKYIGICVGRGDRVINRLCCRNCLIKSGLLEEKQQ